MIDFANVLSNPYIKNIGTPILSIVIITAIKIVSRKDHSLKITKNDIAVGMDLLIVALFMLINCSIQLAEKAKSITENEQQVGNTNNLLTILVLTLLYCLAAFILSILTRIFGWKKEAQNELNLFMGIIVPLIIGGFLLVFAVNYSNI